MSQRILYQFTALEPSSGSWDSPKEWKKYKVSLFSEDVKNVQEGTYPVADFDWCAVSTPSNSHIKIAMSREKFLKCIGIDFLDFSEKVKVTEGNLSNV